MVQSVIRSPQLTSADLDRLAYLRSIQPARSAKLRSSSRGDRIADVVTQVVGSWRFIIIQSCLLMIWIVLNIISWISHWDPYPFILRLSRIYGDKYCLFQELERSGNYLNKQANNFSFIRSKFLNP